MEANFASNFPLGCHVAVVEWGGACRGSFKRHRLEWQTYPTTGLFSVNLSFVYCSSSFDQVIMYGDIFCNTL